MPPLLLLAAVVAGALLWFALSIAASLILGRMIRRADGRAGQAREHRMLVTSPRGGCPGRERLTQSGVTRQGSAPEWVSLR